MPGKLQAVLSRVTVPKPGRPFRVILADHQPRVGSDMGESARPVIEEALAALGIETRLGVDVAAINPAGVTLHSGEEDPAATVVWCAGMQANPLTRLIPVEPRPLGPGPRGRVPAGARDCQRLRGWRRGVGDGGRPPHVRHVLPARPADGAFRRAQRRLRPVRLANVAAGASTGMSLYSTWARGEPFILKGGTGMSSPRVKRRSGRKNRLIGSESIRR